MDEKSLELQERIRHIEEELNRVKKELRELTADSNTTTFQTKKDSETFSGIPKTLQKKTGRERKTTEQIIGDWLPRVFIFVFILGVIWAFIAAMDRGWVSPSLRVLTGFVLAGFLYGFGNRQHQRSRNALGIVLLGGSIVVYISSVFAGNVLYHIIPFYFTVILLAAGMAAGVWMSRKYQSQSLLAVIGVGAYLYPFLFSGDRGNESLFYLYETLIFAGLIFESIQKRYKVTWNIANYAFIFAVLFFAVAGIGQINYVTLLALVIQQLLIICLTFQNRYLTSKELYIPAISTGAFFLYLIGEDVFGSLHSQLYVFYLSAALIYGSLSLIKGKSHRELKNVFFVFSMFYLFVFFSQLFSDAQFTRLTIFTLQAGILYFLSQKRKSILGTLSGFLLLIPVVQVLGELPGYNFTFLAVTCWLLVIGLFLSIYLYSEKSTVLEPSLIKKVFPYVIAILLLLFFSKISEWITYPSSRMYVDIGLSISWMVFVAAMYTAYGFFKEKPWQYIGLAFLFITLGKLVLYDLTTVDIVWRAVLFITLGVIGLFISRIFYSKREKEK